MAFSGMTFIPNLIKIHTVAVVVVTVVMAAAVVVGQTHRHAQTSLSL
jgi:hypothetical protein